MTTSKGLLDSNGSDGGLRRVVRTESVARAMPSPALPIHHDPTVAKGSQTRRPSTTNDTKSSSGPGAVRPPPRHVADGSHSDLVALDDFQKTITQRHAERLEVIAKIRGSVHDILETATSQTSQLPDNRCKLSQKNLLVKPLDNDVPLTVGLQKHPNTSRLLSALNDHAATLLAHLKRVVTGHTERIEAEEQRLCRLAAINRTIMMQHVEMLVAEEADI